MKQTLIEEIALAYKQDKGKVRDHICGTTNNLAAKCGEVMACASIIKYHNSNKHRDKYKSIIKHRTMQLIVTAIKLYESL